MANPDVIVVEDGQEKITVRGMIETIQHQQAEIDRIKAELDEVKQAVARDFNADGEGDDIPEGQTVVGLIEAMHDERMCLNDELADARRERDAVQSDHDMYLQDICEISDALHAPEGIPLQEVAADRMVAHDRANGLLRELSAAIRLFLVNPSVTWERSEDCEQINEILDRIAAIGKVKGAKCDTQS